MNIKDLGNLLDVKDLAGLVKQAQKLQEQAGARMAAIEVVGESGAGLVKVVLNGAHEVKRVNIDAAVYGEGKAVLEDLIAAAFNDGARKLEAAKAKKLASFAGAELPFNPFNVS